MLDRKAVAGGHSLEGELHADTADTQPQQDGRPTLTVQQGGQRKRTGSGLGTQKGRERGSERSLRNAGHWEGSVTRHEEPGEHPAVANNAPGSLETTCTFRKLRDSTCANRPTDAWDRQDCWTES